MKLSSARMGKSRESGFTVVELLVASAITAVLAAMLIGITTGVMTVWNRSRGSLTTSNQVKLALDQLASDLEGAIFRDDGNVWFAATFIESNNPTTSEDAETLQNSRRWDISGTMKPGSHLSEPDDFDERTRIYDGASIEDCAFGRAGIWLRFFTTKQDSNSSGTTLSSPVAVSYQLCRRRVRSVSTEIAYALYRSVVRETGTGLAQSGGVFQIGYNLDPLAANAYSTPDASSEGNPGNVVQPHANQIIANNVIDFGVRLYVREGDRLRIVFPAQPSSVGGTPAASDSWTILNNADETSHLVTSSGLPVDPADAYRHVQPDVVEVMVRVLSDEGVEIIQALESGKISGNWWDLALAHSRVYSRRIQINSRPL